MAIQHGMGILPERRVGFVAPTSSCLGRRQKDLNWSGDVVPDLLTTRADCDGQRQPLHWPILIAGNVPPTPTQRLRWLCLILFDYAGHPARHPKRVWNSLREPDFAARSPNADVVARAHLRRLQFRLNAYAGGNWRNESTASRGVRFHPHSRSPPGNGWNPVPRPWRRTPCPRHGGA